MSEERLSMVVFSGTLDKLMPVGIMAAGGVGMGQEVEIFLTFWALLAFKKGGAENLPVSKITLGMRRFGRVSTMADKVIDARGSFCPGPLMELIRAVKAAAVGETITVLSTDSGSKRDIPLWAQKAGQEFIGVTPKEGYEEVVIKKIK